MEKGINKNILINAFSILEGGGIIYLKYILKYANNYKDLKIFVLASKNMLEAVKDFQNIKFITCNTEFKNILYRMLWIQVNLPKYLKEYNIDVLWSPDAIMNINIPSKCKVVISLQNILPFDLRERKRYPLFSLMRMRLYLLKFLQLQSVKKADLAIYVSKYIKNVVEKFIKKKGNSIVVHHGLDNEYFFNTKRRIIPIEWLKNEYVLYLSRIHPYKNQIEVLEAWTQLAKKRKTNEKLIFIGGFNYLPYYKELRNKIKLLGMEDYVLCKEEVHHDLLPSLYKGAKAHIWASTCESFGIILLEKMASRKIVFAADTEINREIAGNCVVYFNPFKPKELAELLAKYLDDEDFKNEITGHAYNRTLSFNWKDSADKTWQAILDLTK